MLLVRQPRTCIESHAREHPVPIGGASSVEAISWLHWAPLADSPLPDETFAASG